MKPLILILLAAVCAQSQTIADAARRERARQAQVKTTKVFTNEDLKKVAATIEIRPVENPAPGGAATAAAPGAAASTPAAATPALDPLEQWQQDTAKLRTQVRDLMDQETAAQLEINTASAQINAPITSQGAKDQAARALEAAQQKLILIRADLAKARSELEQALQSPPVKK
jgi:hypothetical protein